MPFVSKVISGANSFTDPIQIVGNFNLSIVGSTSPAWDGTLTVQRSTDGTTWRDVDTWSDISSEEVGYDPMLMYYRAGVKTGEYTAGSVTVSINGQATLPGASS